MKELEGVYPLYPVPSYKNGGIHIKKSKRGTFKAAAKKAGMGVQEYANKVLKKGSKASPAMKKKLTLLGTPLNGNINKSN